MTCWPTWPSRLARTRQIRSLTLLTLVAAVMLCGCAPKPLQPYSADTPALVRLPATLAGIRDRRARFREIYCAVLEARKSDLPDYRPCEEAMTRVGQERAGTGMPVALEPSRRRLAAAVVFGIAADCIEPWLETPGTVAAHLRTQGYELSFIRVEGLSSTGRNALLIRDAVMGLPAERGAPRIVLIGYSKGAPDILEALATYPELRGRVVAMVSVAGAVGGSPLANDAEQYQADLLRHFPGATCTSGDGGGVASLRVVERQGWLATHPLPKEVRYYSLVTFPDPEHMSSLLKGSYDKLARVDGRNDSQVIFYDQMVPGGTLVGYLNADHWAVAVPIARRHPTIGSTFVTRNAYPREALAEALLRFVEEDLEQSP